MTDTSEGKSGGGHLVVLRVTRSLFLLCFLSCGAAPISVTVSWSFSFFQFYFLLFLVVFLSTWLLNTSLNLYLYESGILVSFLWTSSIGIPGQSTEWPPPPLCATHVRQSSGAILVDHTIGTVVLILMEKGDLLFPCSCSMREHGQRGNDITMPANSVTLYNITHGIYVKWSFLCDQTHGAWWWSSCIKEFQLLWRI